LKAFCSSSFIIIILVNALIADVKAVRAQESAERVINVLENKKFQKRLTLDLMNIARNGHLLDKNRKDRLKSLGFDFSGNKVVLKSVESQHYYDSQHFRIHYDLTDFHAIDSTDSDNSGFPDYVETMAQIFEDVYDYDINELGYVPPPNDGIHGGNDLYDIYIIKTNAYGYTNYIDSTWGDNPNSLNIVENNAYASYITMRNSYEGFADNTELESIQVTAAHEFFHAIQIGYDGDEELWMLEASAVWMEEEHYDDVNDCYQYLVPRFEDPQKSIRSIAGLLPYGSFILFKYIDEHLGGKNVIQRAWEYSREYDSLEDNYSIDEIDLALIENGHSFKKAFTNMAIANCILSDQTSAGIFAYEEAQGYRNFSNISYGDTVAVELSYLDTINFDQGKVETVISNRLLQPYAAQYLRVNTDVPIQLTLSKFSDINIDGLSINSIIKTLNGNYIIDSGISLNIDPPENIDWMKIAVISTEENTNSIFSYQITATDGVKESIAQFAIAKTFPNPFNNSTTLRLKVIEPQNINISVYDILGKRVKTLSSSYLPEGIHNFEWNGLSGSGKMVSSGVYYIKAIGDTHQEWQKVTLVK
jgi:hypothetical protein